MATPFSPRRVQSTCTRRDAAPSSTIGLTHGIRHHVQMRNECSGRRESSESSTQTSSSLSSSSPSSGSSSSRRSRPIPDFHANTHIPPSTSFAKPVAPRRESIDNISAFTEDDKIFFIHFLRWRLQSGDVPPRAVLEWELAQEVNTLLTFMTSSTLTHMRPRTGTPPQRTLVEETLGRLPSPTRQNIHRSTQTGGEREAALRVQSPFATHEHRPGRASRGRRTSRPNYSPQQHRFAGEHGASEGFRH